MNREGVASDVAYSAAVREGASAAPISALSWSAIFAGAVVAAAVSLILFALASGLGLAAVSPWPGGGASLTTFSVITAIALIVVQWIASGVGGYIAGRLRTRWVGTHTHEVFFRDTAHGFITWALSTLIVTAIVATGVMSAASKLVSAAGRGVAAATSANAGQEGVGVPSTYNIDVLFRSPQPGATPPATITEARAEATRILIRSLTAADVNVDDRAYLVRLVVANTGMPESDARTRVDDVIAAAKADEAKARQAADTARKASSAASIFTALSMVIGAFIGCVAAALGGQLRDQHP
jgi:hypothetical protein